MIVFRIDERKGKGNRGMGRDVGVQIGGEKNQVRGNGKGIWEIFGYCFTFPLSHQPTIPSLFPFTYTLLFYWPFLFTSSSLGFLPYQIKPIHPFPFLSSSLDFLHHQLDIITPPPHPCSYNPARLVDYVTCGLNQEGESSWLCNLWIEPGGRV